MTEILPAVPLRGDYAVNPDFSDDFEGRSLDRSKWVDFYADWKGRAAGFFSPYFIYFPAAVLCDQ